MPSIATHSHHVRGGGKGWAVLIKVAHRMAWMLLAGLLLMAQAGAKPLVLGSVPPGPLGVYAEVLTETERLTPEQAWSQGNQFRVNTSTTPSFGIQSRPIWMKLRVFNPGPDPASIRLLVGAPWTDHLEAYVFPDGASSPAMTWRAGDEAEAAKSLRPTLGYVWPLMLPSGGSHIYIRAESIDPMVLPVELLTEAELQDREKSSAYQYGLLYGFLIALCSYNLLLFGGTNERSYLYYAAYLASYVALNVSNTGHGFAWFWSGSQGFQRYIILCMMAAFSAIGLLFASRFLGLAHHSPRALKGMQWFGGLGVGAMALAVAFNSHMAAAYAAFWFLGLFSVGGVALGVLAVRRKWLSAHYFLGAASCAMLGAGIAVLTVWGWVPFTEWGYRAIEIGVAAEATLLALALAHQVRHQHHKALRAEALARTDPLTGLLNRRAFLAESLPAWRTAARGQRPLCILMLDLDHFKHVNDTHGHEAGDLALVQAARRLTLDRRAGDVLARWGGEEFIMLLPETDLIQARHLAERLRLALAETPIALRSGSLRVTASIGVAQRREHANIEDLIADADEGLLAAKADGRNRVAFVG